MRTLIISDYGVRIRFRDGVFVIENKSLKKTIPPMNIDQLIIATGGVSITSKAIRKAMSLGIDVVFLDSRGEPVGRIYPVYINRTVETRRMQYKAFNTDKKYDVINAIIYAKITNQAGLLKRYYYITRNKYIKKGYLNILSIRDKELPVENTSNFNEKIMEIEARAARIYWSTYSLLIPKDYGFDSRDQDGTDPVNILLNYGYGVLYKEVWRSLVLAGLDPYAGFLHTDRSGKPVLVFDFIEQFRFIVDLIILRLLRKKWKPVIEGGLLSWDSRRYFIEKIEEFLEKEKTTYYTSQPITIRQAMKKTAFQLAAFLRDEALFKGFIYDW